MMTEGETGIHGQQLTMLIAGPAEQKDKVKTALPMWHTARAT
jgi:hypothetical protein